MQRRKRTGTGRPKLQTQIYTGELHFGHFFEDALQGSRETPQRKVDFLLAPENTEIVSILEARKTHLNPGAGDSAALQEEPRLGILQPPLNGAVVWLAPLADQVRSLTHFHFVS